MGIDRIIHPGSSIQDGPGLERFDPVEGWMAMAEMDRVLADVKDSILNPLPPNRTSATVSIPVVSTVTPYRQPIFSEKLSR